MDTSLTLKPVELIDIGIDKLTKLPIPILNDNIISTLTVDDDNIPIDSLIFVINTLKNSLSVSFTIVSSNSMTLSADWGDGKVAQKINIIEENENVINYDYDDNGIYTINISGGVSLINSLVMNNQGVTSIIIRNLKKLNILSLKKNYLSTIDINGLIELNSINVSGNSILDVDYDIYIPANTFLSYNGNIDTTGNALPTSYSDLDRNSLLSKGWTIIY